MSTPDSQTNVAMVDSGVRPNPDVLLVNMIPPPFGKFWEHNVN